MPRSLASARQAMGTMGRGWGKLVTMKQIHEKNIQQPIQKGKSNQNDTEIPSHASQTSRQGSKNPGLAAVFVYFWWEHKIVQPL